VRRALRPSNAKRCYKSYVDILLINYLHTPKFVHNYYDKR